MFDCQFYNSPASERASDFHVYTITTTTSSSFIYYNRLFTESSPPFSLFKTSAFSHPNMHSISGKELTATQQYTQSLHPSPSATLSQPHIYSGEGNPPICQQLHSDNLKQKKERKNSRPTRPPPTTATTTTKIHPIHLIHLSKIPHIHQKHIHLYHVLERRPSREEDRREVFDGLMLLLHPYVLVYY